MDFVNILSNMLTNINTLSTYCIFCGPKEIRTPDLLFAKEARYQLRHGPMCVGMPGLEPGTSSLSVTRSNQLSYTPFFNIKRTFFKGKLFTTFSLTILNPFSLKIFSHSFVVKNFPSIEFF